MDPGPYRLTVEAAGRCGGRRDGLHIEADRGVEELQFVLTDYWPRLMREALRLDEDRRIGPRQE